MANPTQLTVKLPDEGYFAGNNFITKSDFLKLIESVPDDFMFIQTGTWAVDGTYLSVSIHNTAFLQSNPNVPI